MPRNVFRLTAAMVLVSLALVACGPGDELRAGTPATKATESPRQTVPVRRGSIAEVVKGTGRVTSLNETPAYFRVAGRVRTVNVEVGQPVRRGEVVAELEAGQIGVQVEIAKVNLQIAELRSAQAAETSGDSSVQVAAATVAKAQAEHARAIAELETRRAAAGGDVRVWDAAVASARARLTVATLPSQPADIAAAEQAVVSARAAISKAETDLEKTRAGYTPEEIRTQEHALAAAKDVVYAAQVERDAARGRADGAGTAAGDARIAGAQASVDAAADRLRAMKAGGKPEDIAVAEKSVDAARATLGAAEAKLLVIRSGPRPEDVAIAQGSVDEAAARAEQARTTLAGIPSSIDAATAAVDAAAAGVDVARAQYRQRLTEVKAAGGKAVETAIAEKQLDIARLNLQALEQQVEDARIRAPFDGVIGQLAVKPGEQVLAYAPVGTFADPSKLGVSLDVPASDISKVTLGQDATLTLDALGGKTVSEKVVNVPTGLVGVGLPSAGPGETRPVRISLTQPPPGFGIGVAVGVTITTRQKDSALIIPAVAVKRFGGRRLVQVVGADGRRRDVEVETGITTDTDVEITDGLTEGQVVVAS